MHVDGHGNEWMDGADGPIFREVRSDGALVMTQGDTVWVTEGYADPIGGYAFEKVAS